MEENNTHMVYFCTEIKYFVDWFKRLLIICLGRNNFRILKLLFFDTTSMKRKEKNTVIILVANYICTIWNSRGTTGDKICMMKNKI